MFFKRKKKLNLQKIHRLYQILEHTLPQQEEKYLIDELDKMLEKARPGTMLRALKVMYKNLEGKSDMMLFVMFVQGLRDNNFFEYANFIRGLKRGRHTERH